MSVFSNKSPHYTVLKNEVIDFLNIKENQIYVDCTFGFGGHSIEILKKLNNTGKLIAFEKDKNYFNDLQLKFKNYKNLHLINDDFVNITENLKKLNIFSVDGIVFDLGLSTVQITDLDRGFSYKNDCTLDMRFNQDQKFSAFDVINFYNEEKLANVFFYYGQERNSKKIANTIVYFRKKQRIKTSKELIYLIKKAITYKKKVSYKNVMNSIKRVFQAIRIEVNNELNFLEKAIESALQLLKVNGILAVISFHSLEDKIIKKKFLNYSKLLSKKYILINKKVVKATEKEVQENSNSKSAKLRVIKRLS